MVALTFDNTRHPAAAAAEHIVADLPAERGGLGPMLDLLPEGLYRWLVRRRLRDVLESRNDRLLADVGFDRARLGEQIAGIADVLAQRRRERLKIYRELSAYSDRELDELGIARRDIGAISRGEMPRTFEVSAANPATSTASSAAPANDRVGAAAA